MKDEINYNFQERAARILKVWERSDDYKKKHLLEFLGVPVIITDKKGRFLDINTRGHYVLGYDRESSLKQSFAKLTALQDIISNQRAFQNGDGVFCFRDKDGNPRYFFMNSHNYKDYAIHFLVEASGYHHPQEALLVSEQRYTNLLENAVEGICLIGKEQFIFVNEKISRIFGYHREEMLKADPCDFVSLEEREKIRRYIKRIFDKQILVRKRIEREFIHKNGTHILCEAVYFSTMYNGQFALQGHVRDINEAGKSVLYRDKINDITGETTEKEKNELLYRFSLIGEMARILAHEMRNPMTTVRGLAQLLASEDSPNRSYYELMIDEVDRANSIINQFLSFTKDIMQKEEIELSELIYSIPEVLSGEALSQKINLVIINDPNPVKLYVDRSQIQQALSNILKNALEACEPGDSVIIETGKKDGYAWVCFTDEGKGISFNNLKHVIEPFFTTKETHNGLGLSVSYKIIKDHGGDITVESWLDKGTKVEVYLPCTNTDENTDLSA